MKRIALIAMVIIFSSVLVCGVSFAGAVDGALDGIDTEMEQVQQSFEDSMADESAEQNNGLITEDGDDFVSPPAEKTGSGGSSRASDEGVLIK